MVKADLILRELRHHAPFTALGALTGILLLVLTVELLTRMEHEHLFHFLHPLHLFLSATVTTAIYRKYGKGRGEALVVGFFGSVGICTLSDIFLPHLGGLVLGIPMHFHLCLLEHPYLVLPAVMLGMGLGMMRPSTELPHSGHVLVSTYASTFYLTAFGSPSSWLPFLPALFFLLFLAVWLPCCTSDFIFPLLFLEHPSLPEGTPE
ncbi:MAG: hypothetical protein QXF20_03285 [Candidatus Hadarchaeales archaeon]